MITCVVFDLDGTLVDIGDLFGRVFATFLNRLHLPAIGFDRKGDPWASAYDAFVSRFPRLADLVGGKAFGDAWEDCLKEGLSRGEVRLYDGAFETLGHLRESGRRLALATNTPKRFVQIKLCSLQLHDFFDHIFTPQDPWGAKPNPRSLLYLLDYYSLFPSEVLVVGDHAQDVQYGRNAGVRTAFVINGYGGEAEGRAARPEVFVKSVKEIVKIVETL